MNAWLALVPRLVDGWILTLRLLAVSIPLGLAVGVAIGVARVYGPRPVRVAAAVYQSVLRVIPLVVQLFLLYYVLPRAGLLLSPFAAAAAGFALCSGAYHSEYIRSAISSIPFGQMEAARALGMSHFLAIRTIILPQTARRALPGCGNELVYLVKYSSLAYLVTLVDLMGAGRIEASASFRFFETFLVVGMLYLLMVAIVRAGLHLLQRYWRRSTARVSG
jgi:polar amino acid transport system permease protein